jgi:hypothetical protein
VPIIPPFQVKTGYKPQSEDTSMAADVLMFQLLRQLTPLQKVLRTSSFNQAVRNLARLGIQKQYPAATSLEIKQEFICRCLGAEWIEILAKYLDESELMIQDPVWLAGKIADILEPLNILYMIGGSVASSLWGENRSTQDLDLLISISAAQVPRLISAMSGDFYISDVAVAEALELKTSFNVIYLPSLEKADIFIMGVEPFAISKMSRRQLHINASGDRNIYIYSPEDIILQKLRWYKQINSQSQKQWRDVLGVLKVQSTNLDFSYLNQWADNLQFSELLVQAIQEAGL